MRFFQVIEWIDQFFTLPSMLTDVNSTASPDNLLICSAILWRLKEAVLTSLVCKRLEH